jgi:hypothetical protein
MEDEKEFTVEFQRTFCTSFIPIAIFKVIVTIIVEHLQALQQLPLARYKALDLVGFNTNYNISYCK